MEEDAGKFVETQIELNNYHSDQSNEMEHGSFASGLHTEKKTPVDQMRQAKVIRAPGKAALKEKSIRALKVPAA